MSKLPAQREETLGGIIVHGIPFPIGADEESLEFLKKMAPIQIEQDYQITYLHSYGQDSPWFAALTNKRLLASRDPESGYTYANPRGNDMYSGAETKWVDITDIPEVQMWDEAVVMGSQGNEEITVHDVAKLKNSVSYDVLTNWRLRLRRKSVNGEKDASHGLNTDKTLIQK